MTVTEIDINAGGVVVTIAKTSGDPLTEDSNSDLIADTSDFGIDSLGRPYFDTAGASHGEWAALGVDQQDNVFLERA